MSYTPSPAARSLLKNIATKGKDRALRPPGYKPLMERPAVWLAFGAVLAAAGALALGAWRWSLGLLALGLLLFGLKELFIQDDHAIVRIYGPFGRLRYIFENLFRDKYLQYFNESNTDGRPMPRIVRDYVYQKAHDVKAFSSFGTELDNFDFDNSVHGRLLHRNFPGQFDDPNFLVTIGEKRKGVRPFAVRNTVNVSAMSYGSINYRSAESLSIGAKGVAYVNTGEGGYGPHGVAGNDVVFQLGTAKFGVGDNRDVGGKVLRVLNDQLLRELVRENENIRMIQIKISQGAKPSLGGHLPGDKVTPEIAAVRRVTPGQTLISPAQHLELVAATPKETIAKLMDFCKHLRKITELPVGIKLCVGRPEEIDLLVAAMKKTGEGPDAIQVDGADGGTGAGPNLYVNYVGYGSATETVHMFDRSLKKAGIRDRVTLHCSGRLLTPAHAASAFAAGADYIDTARGAMLSLGCIQSLKCHTNHCPTGIATNSPWRTKGLVVPEKSTRVHQYLKHFHEDMLKLTRSLGHRDPRDIGPDDLRVTGM